jgi:sulfoxide reductase heme-binding subunit YedZ
MATQNRLPIFTQAWIWFVIFSVSFPTPRQIRFVVKPLWFLACLAPFLWLLLNAFEIAGPGLGADPIEAIQDFMGEWGLRMLLLTLAITPLRQLTGRAWFAQFRRMTGLFALFYISLHFLNYLLLDQGLSWQFILEDVLERRFITLGMIALLALIPLGITSTNGWRRRLGRKWTTLHRLIYPIAILGCWHYWWQVKKDITEPAIYAAVLALLLGYRLYLRRKKSRARLPERGESTTRSATN